MKKGLTFLLIVAQLGLVFGYAVLDIRQDEKAKLLHRLDTLNILAYVCILILIVCTIWLFKHKRVKFVHETGLAIIYGLIVGAIIRYAGRDTDVSQLSVIAKNESFLNETIKYGPPDMLWIEFNVPAGVQEDVNGRFIQKSIGSNATLPVVQAISLKDGVEARSYAYVFQGEIYNPQTDGTLPQNKKILEKATFDPEIFFNLILPLIVFNAGYSLKRKFFFRNFGAIMTYAFFGTTISCFVVAIVMKSLVWLLPTTLAAFSFTDCLYFGAIISATDPVTVLAIFNDLRVDVTLHALVFGESIFNDVICIVLASSIDSFSHHYLHGFFFAIWRAFTNFLYIFVCSLIQGSLIGCATALLTKFTKLCDHPLLESTLFVLCSYASFLLSEAFELSGIVSVLFCGICQAHYTYNNLSTESRIRTKSLFEMCNFIAENFVFAYIGVSIFTFPQHLWNFWFILWSFIAIILGRALNIYPLSYLLNLGRHNKIPREFQHVLFASGLRGAMAFALAIRNTLTEPRRMMLTSTSIVSISSVIVCGSSIKPILQHFMISTNVEEALDRHSSGFGGNQGPNTSFNRFRDRSGSGDQIISPVDDVNVGPATGADLGLPPAAKNVYEKAWLVRKWYNFDTNFMKPLLTHARPSLMETMPSCCLPVSRWLTSTAQLMDSSEHSMIISTNQPAGVAITSQPANNGRKILHNDDIEVGDGENLIENQSSTSFHELLDDEDPYGRRRGNGLLQSNGTQQPPPQPATGNLVMLNSSPKRNSPTTQLSTIILNSPPRRPTRNNYDQNSTDEANNPFEPDPRFISFSTHSSPRPSSSTSTSSKNSSPSRTAAAGRASRSQQLELELNPEQLFTRFER